MPSTTYRHPTVTNSAAHPRVVGITGASGLIGAALAKALTDLGHTVIAIPHRQSSRSPYLCDYTTGSCKLPESLQVLVHLAGEPIAARRWSPAQKERIRDSRVHGTTLLCAEAKKLPALQTFLSASAIGYYGDRGNELLDESSAAGDGFLAETAVAWEGAGNTLPVRTVHARFGIVLSCHGGALAKMLLPFRLGLGGHLGDGSQWMSCIDLPSAIEILLYAIFADQASGPLNLVAKDPITNYQFTKMLGCALHRPTVFPVPAFALRLALGEMSALLLSSTRVVSSKLPAELLPTTTDAIIRALR